MSPKSRSNRSAHRWPPVEPSISCTVMRSRLPAVGGGHLIRLHRLRIVFQAMLPEIRAPGPDLAAHVAEHRLGDHDGAWSRQGLEPGGDDDAVAIEVAALDGDIPEVDRDPE